jgi:hypothetical protein
VQKNLALCTVMFVVQLALQQLFSVTVHGHHCQCCKILKISFGKYMYSTGAHIPLLLHLYRCYRILVMMNFLY